LTAELWRDDVTGWRLARVLDAIGSEARYGPDTFAASACSEPEP